MKVGQAQILLLAGFIKRVIAEPDNGRCAVSAVVYDKTDADTGEGDNGAGCCEFQEVVREREHRGISFAWLLKIILSMVEILAARPDSRGGNCHHPGK